MSFRCAIVALALVAAVAARAQPAHDPEAIEREIANAPEAEKSALYVKLSDALDSIDPERAWKAAQRALETAKSPHEQLLAEAQMSEMQRWRGQYADALAIARTALTRAEELHDDPARAEILLRYARANWSLADYPAVMAAHQELIGLAEKLGNKTLVGRGHLGLSVVYGELHERQKARDEEEAALKIAREAQDRELEADALNNLGNNYTNAGDLAQARSMHEQALAVRTGINNRRGMGDSLINLAEVARQLHDPATALKDIDAAYAIYEKLGIKRYMANADLAAATVLRETGRLDEALKRLVAGYARVETSGNHSFLASYHAEFSRLYAARGDWRAAYDSERKRAEESNTVLGERSREQIAALNARYEADRRQQEIVVLRGEQALKDAELQRAQWLRYALLGALGLGALAAGALVSRQRLKLRAEQRVLRETMVARDAAEEADRVKTRFLGIASHDIRTPLGNIVNLASHLQLETRRNDPRAEQLDVISSEAQRVLCLVEDLLTIAALETGKLELRLAPLDLGETARAVVSSLRWQAEAKRQQIVFPETPPHTGLLDGDATRLHQVISNLLSNAIKFSPPGKTITLDLRRTQTHVTLAVHDEGPGISAQDLARLFAPFQRLAAHAGAATSSHGLGLSIAHEIVRLHGGEIRVESVPGEGTTFTMELPLVREKS